MMDSELLSTDILAVSCMATQTMSKGKDGYYNIAHAECNYHTMMRAPQPCVVRMLRELSVQTAQKRGVINNARA